MSPVLEARNVTAGYGGPPAIRDVSIRVDAGEIVALLGPNGAGKTTTLLSLVGELPLRNGEVHLFGERTVAPLHRRARAGLGFVREGRSVFKSMSTRDNLRLGGAVSDDIFGLFPELESRLNVRGGLLSGGEQQMLSVGRALCRKPKVFLADELSLGLAPMVVTRLLEAISQEAHAQGTGVLLVEQQVRKVLRYADRVYVLRRGEVVMDVAASEARDRILEIESTYMSGD